MTQSHSIPDEIYPGESSGEECFSLQMDINANTTDQCRDNKCTLYGFKINKLSVMLYLLLVVLYTALLIYLSDFSVKETAMWTGVLYKFFNGNTSIVERPFQTSLKLLHQ